MLDLAIRKCAPAIVELLLQNGADPNGGRDYAYHKQGWGSYSPTATYTCLSDAIWNVKSRDMVQLLLKYGADPNYSYTDFLVYGGITDIYNIKMSSLAEVILWNPDIEMMHILLKAGADPNAVYRGRSTVPVLYLAFMKANDEMIRLLLDAGASLDSPVTTYNSDGQPMKSFPLKYAGLPTDYRIMTAAKKVGWKGPSLFRGGEVTVYTK